MTQAVALRLTADRRAPGLAASSPAPPARSAPSAQRDANPPLPGLTRHHLSRPEGSWCRGSLPSRPPSWRVSSPQAGGRARRRGSQRAPAGRGGPAISWCATARKLILCGPAIALSTALQGDYDRLALAMLHLLSDGRRAPVGPGPRLRLKQSAAGGRRAGPGRDAAPDDEPRQHAAPVRSARQARQARPDSAGFTLVEEPATEFNLSGQLGGKQVELLLNHWNAANTLQVTLGAEGVRVVHTTAGKARGLARVKTPVRPGTPFVVKVRHARLLVIAGTVVAAARLEGVSRGAIAVRGAVTAPRYQPVEPALFSDDFMRTSDEDGGWETHGGTWKTAPVQNPNLGANRSPTAWRPARRRPWRSWATPTGTSTAAPSRRAQRRRGAVGLGLYARTRRTCCSSGRACARGGALAEGSPGAPGERQAADRVPQRGRAAAGAVVSPGGEGGGAVDRRLRGWREGLAARDDLHRRPDYPPGGAGRGALR